VKGKNNIEREREEIEKKKKKNFNTNIKKTFKNNKERMISL